MYLRIFTYEFYIAWSRLASGGLIVRLLNFESGYRVIKPIRVLESQFSKY